MESFASIGFRGQVSRLERLARVALRQFDLPPADLKLLAHMQNTTFRVTAGDLRYVLRIHPPGDDPGDLARNMANVRSEMDWLAALRRDTSLIVPEPVPARDGSLVTVAATAGVPEPRMCVLMHWVEGRFIDKGLTLRHLEQVGRFTAALHHQAETFRPPDGFTRGRIAEIKPDYRAYAARMIVGALGPAMAAPIGPTVDTAEEAQGRLGQGTDAFGLIHADLHQANYLFHHGMVRAIDFEDCGWGHFAYDLAVTLSGVDYRPDYPELRAALLRGYRAVRPFSVDQEPFVDAYQRYRKLQIALWFVEERHHPGFADWEDEARELLGALVSS